MSGPYRISNIYPKSRTLCKKQDNLCYVFIHKKPDTLCYAIFMTFLIFAFIYLQKAWHFALRDVFIYKKPDTLRYAIFMEFLKLAEGGGIFRNKKQCTLRRIFICKKQCTLRYVFIYKKPDTLPYILIF